MADKGMTVKEWLMRARNLDREIEHLRAEKQDAFDFATKITAECGGEVVQTSKKNTTEKKFVSYAEYDEKIHKRVGELFKVKIEIQHAIEKVDDSVLRTLLFTRYIQHWTWEQIAVDLHYTYTHVVHNLHPKALNKVKELIEFNTQSVI